MSFNNHLLGIVRQTGLTNSGELPMMRVKAGYILCDSEFLV